MPKGFCYGVSSKSDQIFENLWIGYFFKKLSYRSNSDDSLRIGFSRELKNHMLPLVVARMLVFTATMVLRLSEFKASLELRRDQWEWDKLKCHRVHCSEIQRCFLNEYLQIVAKLWLISTVLKKSSFWQFFLPIFSLLLWKHYFLGPLTLAFRKCFLFLLF